MGLKNLYFEERTHYAYKYLNEESRRLMIEAGLSEDQIKELSISLIHPTLTILTGDPFGEEVPRDRNGRPK